MTKPTADEHESPAGRIMYLAIAVISAVAIATHLLLAYGTTTGKAYANWPLFVALVIGGGPVVWELAIKLVRLEFGSDLLAAISIITAALLGEYLAGAIVVLMVSGGETIERLAVQRASSVLAALARRMPTVAHRKSGNELADVPIESIAIGDLLAIFPHEIAPVDGLVTAGHGTMNEAFLTGEPYQMSKTPGSEVISGALNGESALTIRATRRASDSRYAQIMQVMRASQVDRPRIRRLGDQLGAIYTPVAIAVAAAAWLASGDSTRFLAVLVTATPCPLLIAIPVALIGAISLAARRGILIKKPAVLEQIDQCTTIIFDKTGTLTYGQPKLVEQLPATNIDSRELLGLAASLERYSKHPLASAILEQAEQEGIALVPATEISERPGQGLTGVVSGRRIQVTSRRKLANSHPQFVAQLPPAAGGLECVFLVDEAYAGTFRFRDAPREGGRTFIRHLRPRHQVQRVLIVSGDRESEVRYLADSVGISEVFAEQSPEQKLAIVQRETKTAKTMFIGDGINDAPALAMATVGLAFGTGSDITSEAAGAVVMDSSLEKVDELLHISARLRRIALQSAIGGMALSLGGMILAAVGILPPVGGALLQEVIDVIAVLNAVRVAIPPRHLSDFGR
ncbi:MAG: heavy metal translocating P-type ATPase [Pirellulaceae bacterium]|nr:heavy metal translocating P-type ATPase [Pirellulaceae bacterium]